MPHLTRLLSRDTDRSGIPFCSIDSAASAKMVGLITAWKVQTQFCTCPSSTELQVCSLLFRCLYPFGFVPSTQSICLKLTSRLKPLFEILCKIAETEHIIFFLHPLHRMPTLDRDLPKRSQIKPQACSLNKIKNVVWQQHQVMRFISPASNWPPPTFKCKTPHKATSGATRVTSKPRTFHSKYFLEIRRIKQIRLIEENDRSDKLFTLTEFPPSSVAFSTCFSVRNASSDVQYHPA